MIEDSGGEIDSSWSGERYVPGVVGNVELEHLHRYMLAREFVVHRDVLDIACGEGYGSAMLAEVASSVIGVDIVPDVVAHAERKYRSTKIQFKVGSCTRIPIPDASIDVVVSFETIEHHDQHDAMLAEIKRVLRPHGFLIISSPDRYEYSVVPNYQNPFHVKELDRQEFTQLLHANFKHVVMYGQRIVYGSVILPDGGAAEVRCYQRQHSGLVATTGIPRPLYLIAIASDETVEERQGGILEESLEASDFARSVIGERDIARTHHDQAVAEREQARAERDQAVAEREQARAEREAAGIELERLRIQAANQAQRISTLEDSIGWRLLEPYRQLIRSSAALSFLHRRLAGPIRRWVVHKRRQRTWARCRLRSRSFGPRISIRSDAALTTLARYSRGT